MRLQYIGGEDYEKKASDILEILSQFCVTAWDCTVNKEFTRDDIQEFEKIVERFKKIRSSYLDYNLFNNNYPKIKFTVDLIQTEKTVYQFYQNLRDRIFDLLSNMDFKGEVLLNYDTTLSTLQIKDANITCINVSNIELIDCNVNYGNFTNCDFYDCKVNDAYLKSCNLFLNSTFERCKFLNSFSNRTTILTNCEFDGDNAVFNGKMIGGLFRRGSIGHHAEISKETTVIEYRQLRIGYMVFGDKIIIPTKKFDML